MAFTATINSINMRNDRFDTSVTFADSASGWTSVKVYSFVADIVVADAQAQIVADGTVLKANLVKNNALQAKVGAVITI